MIPHKVVCFSFKYENALRYPSGTKILPPGALREENGALFSLPGWHCDNSGVLLIVFYQLLIVRGGSELNLGSS